MKQHHPFGPSVFARRLACPQSYYIERELDDVTAPESEHGTRLHEEIAECLRTGREPSMSKLEPLLLYARTLSLGASRIAIEEEVRIEYEGEELFGTPDLVIYYPNENRIPRAMLIDFKFGRAYYSVLPQLWLYAAIVLRAHP